MIETSVKILSNTCIMPNIFLMKFASPAMAAQARPGQFIMVKVSDSMDPSLRRPFSISNTEKEGVISVLYKVAGRGTLMLSNKRDGEQLSVLGPLGNGFDIAAPGQHLFIAAGGIGIAPMLFLSQKADKNAITFMAGFRTSDEIIDPALLGIKQGIAVATDDGSKGYHGWVTGLLEEEIKKQNKSSAHIYACGPVPMLKRVSSMAIKYNIPCMVSMETFMACGLGACQGCIVRAASVLDQISYLHVCKDGPVFDINEINWEKI
ncbi:MAG: dihydroorotate dehydrogenase electron transfer subunit [Deltaproteobacteria bacterium]|jgi:dihydroorotate dehydrogenase electron transfer subunit|nr:dihydroorotate dehydrogenase electron transfer subunit [Deltaproteobacteria bacterium]